ncbi:hypothetical protein NKI88_02360 [Mesorhizobium sp. M0317]|uniref:hypothetical protein n=1 Tax=Mesorhizobium sp. M0317 TaxID=2956935 RepID=UPI00333BBA69
MKTVADSLYAAMSRRRPKQQTPEQMQAACDAFNATYAVGNVIECWTGPREGRPVEREIRHPACVLGGHTPVVYIAGGGGCVALTHVADWVSP